MNTTARLNILIVMLLLTTALAAVAQHNLPQPSPAVRVEAEQVKGNSYDLPRGQGKWAGWLRAEDVNFGYLPGTQNVDSGISGFKVYYQCGQFTDLPGNGVAMTMVFDNDKGGSLGIASWVRKPDPERFIKVRFEGAASFSQKASETAKEAPYKGTALGAGITPAGILNSITDSEGLCANAYKTIAVQRPIIAKFLMRKDIQSMSRLYNAVSFIPGPQGVFSAMMEVSLALGQQDYIGAGTEVFCEVGGMFLGKITKGVTSPIIKYLIDKGCDGAVNVVSLVSKEDASGGSGLASDGSPLYFTGVLKDVKESLYRVEYHGIRSEEAIIARLGLGYLEKEETVKNIFFDNWR